MSDDRFPFSTADVSELHRIYLDTLERFRDFASTLTETQWSLASPCPGWTTGDVVAHTLALESELHGVPVPEHEPDWDELPHVTNPVSRYTEIPVDWYRSQSRDGVIAQLDEIVEWRRDDFASATDQDPNTAVRGFAGIEQPQALMIRTRILDVWLHLQDLRDAVGVAGDLDVDGAWITASQLASGLGFVWGKRVGASPGSSLHLDVTGPGVTFSRAVVINDAGRGETTDTADATVQLTMTWPDYFALAAGRAGAVQRALRGSVEIVGDSELAAQALERFAVTP